MPAPASVSDSVEPLGLIDTLRNYWQWRRFWYVDEDNLFGRLMMARWGMGPTDVPKSEPQPSVRVYNPGLRAYDPVPALQPSSVSVSVFDKTVAIPAGAPPMTSDDIERADLIERSKRFSCDEMDKHGEWTIAITEKVADLPGGVHANYRLVLDGLLENMCDGLSIPFSDLDYSRKALLAGIILAYGEDFGDEEDAEAPKPRPGALVG